MGIFDKESMAEHEAASVQDLFSRIVAAEADRLTDEQRAAPREYLLATWREAAEMVMRPLQRYQELQRKHDELVQKLYPDTDQPF